MRHTHAILDCLPPALSMEQRTRARQITTALDLLKQVQDCTESKFLSPDEIEELEARIDRLLQHMREYMPDETVKQKGHMLFRHAMEFARQWGNLSWFSEQGIESLHAVYRRQAERYKMKDLRRQVFMLRWNFSQCVLEARQPQPEDAEEYEFRDNPVYFEEDGEDDEGDSEDDDT
ncbi:hypothetical protein DdX_00635 [Ditylenchus destructor]|uniref:Uncharacterized protein n=1 Tax=Ditylenchus destructor TaxID=166010 RepID=A0AAD4RD33_9BILA|nr:hypothetical protein DdX_00635 [Ditylenchus destructor]